MRVRTHFRVDQAKLDRALRILGTRTETETVELALDLVAFRDEAIQGVRRLAAANAVEDVFEEEPRPGESEEALTGMFNAAADSLSETEKEAVGQEREAWLGAHPGSRTE